MMNEEDDLVLVRGRGMMEGQAPKVELPPVFDSLGLFKGLFCVWYTAREKESE